MKYVSLVIREAIKAYMEVMKEVIVDSYLEQVMVMVIPNVE
ncbi:MAG: hypothetical protein V8R63_11790 [Thomasclavelia ramosa]